MAHYGTERENDLALDKEWKPLPVRQVKEPEQVNNFLLQLLSFRNEIELGGWIVIPPTLNNHSLELRVEWFVDREKLGYSYHFGMEELKRANSDLIKVFIIRANKFIRVKTGKATREQQNES